MIKLNGKVVEFNKLPNGEFIINMEPLAIVKFQRFMKPAHYMIELKWEDDTDLIKLMFIKNSLCGVYTSELIIYYMPYSRMDRTEGKYVFTLKHVCDFINTLNFTEVTVLDPHSEVTCALLNRSVAVYPVVKLVNNHYPCDRRELPSAPEFMIYFPDTGALKKYEKMFPNTEFAFGVKKRNFGTGAIERLDIVGEVKGKHVVMVDDICVYGGTFIKGAEKLKELGARSITLAVSHCEKNIFRGEIPASPLIDCVLTSNTILEGSEGKVTVVNIEYLI